MIDSFFFAGSLIFWGYEDKFDYVDALFVITSASTVTGLSSIDFTQVSRGGQVIVLIWILLGGLINVSIGPIIVRLVVSKYREATADRPGEMEIMSDQTSRILKMLIVTIFLYAFCIELFAFLLMGAYLQSEEGPHRVMVLNGVDSGWWWAIFHTISYFQNAGFSLFASSLMPFANDRVISLTCTFIVVAGNTLYPIFLRVVLRVVSIVVPSRSLRDDIDELLRNPRYFYQLLFPLRGTLALLAFWVAITLAEWCIFFVEFNRVIVYGYPFSAGIKLMIDFVQTVAVRASGYNNVNVGLLTYGHLSFLIVSMYISVFPMVLTVRKSNKNDLDDEKVIQTASQARRFLARDLIWVYLVIVVINFIESPGSASSRVPNPFLSLCFEVSSAFGTVGLSMGKREVLRSCVCACMRV